MSAVSGDFANYVRSILFSSRSRGTSEARRHSPTPAPPQTDTPRPAPSANVSAAMDPLQCTAAAAPQNYRWRAYPCLRAIPNLFQNRFPRNHAAFAAHQVAQKLRLHQRQMDRVSRRTQFEFSEVNRLAGK